MTPFTSRSVTRALLDVAPRHAPADVAAALSGLLAKFGKRNLRPLILSTLRGERQALGAMDIETVRVLSEDKQQELRATITARFPDRHLTFRVNKHVVGGFRVSVDGMVIDATLRTALRNLARIVEAPHGN